MRATSQAGSRQLPGGRWSRRGRVIVVDLGPGTVAEEQEVGGELPFERRVIHPRIDVSAQRALITMSNGSLMDQIRAEDILTQVEMFVLGIYQQDQQRPALLAREQNRNWWQLLEAGQNSDILCDPNASITTSPNKPRENAVFYFRKNLSKPLLITELRSLSDLQKALVCVGSFPGPGPALSA